MEIEREDDKATFVYDEVVRIAGTGAPKPVPFDVEGKGQPGRASIGDVARLAEVAPITVSRALRNPEMVSPDKRLRIQRAVEETGYSVNPHASALKSGRSNIVLAFASNLMSEQFSLALRSCTAVLEDAGYLFLVGQTSYSYERETAAIRSLHAMKPAAVMFTGVIELETNRELLRGLGIPIMETWALPRDPIDMLVGFSNTEAGWIAADILHRKGYRTVSYVGRRGGRGALRLKGFHDGCRALGMTLLGEHLIDDVNGVSDGRRCLAAAISQAARPEALFCSNDVLALGCMMEARRLNIRVPNDLGILGFGESDIAAEIPPGLTTIGIDSAMLGRKAGEMLISSLSGAPFAGKLKRLDLRVSDRGSV
ncbi:LacI family DNA-binding transcriptional regulator [Rhizobium tumorigenes]|uniref:LacI family DNA-binding transcriptional regulator n=1 Tax=Rhizobium tumorigenes TaxID=2041385 RepID=A0AAF1KSV1_9HYPH|nr:LacI family DNA-binding transcriptional regulator [Rhizobium tumorigenes]WFR98048.1 LacI family DNA-binding transcriptional regulator [Rhizobium tumorigenes]